MELGTHKLPNIVLLPPPLFLGHMIPFIELANKLVSDHNCTVSLVIPHDGSPDNKPQNNLLEGNQNISTKMINPIYLPPVSTEDLPENAPVEVVVTARVIRSLPSLRETLSSLRDSGNPAAALVVDFFTTYAIDVARELNLPAYIFYAPAANSLSIKMELALMKPSECSSDLDSRPVFLPGSIKLSRDDYFGFMKDPKGESYARFVDICKRQLSADGILVNSFLDVEPQAFEYLERHSPDGVPPVYPVGPLIRTDPKTDLSHPSLDWLDHQPPRSVLYVSFGSVGGLSVEQIKELALGLETSEQRFLWVVRRPQENAAASYLNNRIDHDLDFLPIGFVERTKGRGLVVATWVPQVRVLSHGSTGGFLTHCGWNSIMESAVYGVPLIGWPLCFDHKVNAVVATEVMEAAIRVKKNENGIVEREHIAGVVKEVMEGEEGERIRKRTAGLKIGAEKALMEDGSSTQALAKVVKKWRSNGE